MICYCFRMKFIVCNLYNDPLAATGDPPDISKLTGRHIMRKLSVIALGFAFSAAVLAATSASATTFLFSYTSNDLSQTASGSLNATLVSPGEYDATSGSITATGPVVTGVGTLIANLSSPNTVNSPSGRFSYDDQLLPASNPVITNGGLLFSIGGSEVNIFSNGPEPGNDSFYNQSYANTSGTFSLSAVPEPATWAMMLVGFGFAGVTLRSSRGKRAIAA